MNQTDTVKAIAALAKAGDIAGAIEAGKAIEDARERNWALRDAARALAQAEQGDAAISLLRNIEDARARLRGLNEVVEAAIPQDQETALRALGVMLATEAEAGEDEQDPFLKGLARLTSRWKTTVGGCGCCGSPYTTYVGDRDARRGRYISGDNGRDMEFVNGRVCDALRWCEKKGVRYRLLHKDGTLTYVDEEGTERTHRLKRWADQPLYGRGG